MVLFANDYRNNTRTWSIRKIWNSSAWRSMKEDLINAHKYLNSESKVDRAKLFSVMCGNWKNGNGQKQKHRKYHKNMEEFLYFEGDRALGQAAQRGRGVPLEKLKTSLDVYLCNLLNGTALAVGQGDLQKSLPTSMIL